MTSKFVYPSVYILSVRRGACKRHEMSDNTSKKLLHPVQRSGCTRKQTAASEEER